MGLNLDRLEFNLVGVHQETSADFTFDASYPTGGEPLTAAMLAMSQIHWLAVVSCDAGYVFAYDRANAKLKVLDGTSGEVANATDLSAVTGTLVARGY